MDSNYALVNSWSLPEITQKVMVLLNIKIMKLFISLKRHWRNSSGIETFKYMIERFLLKKSKINFKSGIDKNLKDEV